MKIIFVNSKQFHDTWNKLYPAQRVSADIHAPNIMLHHLDAMLVLEGSVSIGSITAFQEAVNLEWLTNMILSETYIEVG